MAMPGAAPRAAGIIVGNAEMRWDHGAVALFGDGRLSPSMESASDEKATASEASSAATASPLVPPFAKIVSVAVSITAEVRPHNTVPAMAWIRAPG